MMIFNEEMWTDGTFFLQRPPEGGVQLIGVDSRRGVTQSHYVALHAVTSLNQVTQGSHMNILPPPLPLHSRPYPPCGSVFRQPARCRVNRYFNLSGRVCKSSTPHLSLTVSYVCPLWVLCHRSDQVYIQLHVITYVVLRCLMIFT